MIIAVSMGCAMQVITLMMEDTAVSVFMTQNTSIVLRIFRPLSILVVVPNIHGMDLKTLLQTQMVVLLLILTPIHLLNVNICMMAPLNGLNALFLLMIIQ